MFIRTKLLILFLAIALVPLLFIGTLSFFTAQNALEKATLLNLNAIAEFRESELFLHLERLKTRTVDFSSDGFIGGKLEEFLAQPADREMLVNDLSLYLAEHKKILDPTLMTVDVLGLDGRIIASSEAGRINTDRSKEQYFLNGQKRIYMEGLHREDGRGFGLDIAAPTHRRGRPSEVTGVIVNHYDMSSVNEMMRGDLVRSFGAKTQFREIAQTGKTYLVNGDRFIIGGSSLGSSIPFQLKADTLPVRKCFEEGGEMTGIWPDYRGVPVIGFSMCIAVDGLKWALITEQDQDEAFAVIAGLGRFSMVSVAIIIFLISMIALSVTKMISNPIHALHKGMEMISQGNWDYKVGTDKRDEIGQLSRAFDRMTENLKKVTASRDTLEKEIQRRKEAQEHLRQSEEKYRNLVDNALVGVFSSSLEGEISYVNDAMVTMMEFDSPEEMKKIKAVGLYKNRKDREALIAKLKASGKVYNHELDFLTKDGKPKKILVSAFLDGNQTLHGTVVDITERQQAQAELVRHAQELARVNEELERFNQLAAGRELRIVELKERINELSRQAGKEPPYDLSFPLKADQPLADKDTGS